MKIGYARVSTKDQNLDLQIDALKKAGVDEIHTEIVSGAKADRPVLAETLKNSAPVTSSSSGNSTASAAPSVI